MASGRTLVLGIARQLNARRPRVLALTVFGMILLHEGSATGVSANENVAFKELGGEQCFMFSRLIPYRAEGDHYVKSPLELVINNEQDYKKLFEPQIRRQSCDNIDPSKAIPSVNFAKQTVLVLFSSGSCADTDLERKVLKDEIAKQVIYSVTVVGSDMACSGPGIESLNLIAVPKIPAGYKVFFENLRKHQ